MYSLHSVFFTSPRASKLIAPRELSYASGYIRYTSISHYINNKDRPNRPTTTLIDIWKIRFKSRLKNQCTNQDMLLLNQWYKMEMYTRKNEFTKQSLKHTNTHIYLERKSQNLKLICITQRLSLNSNVSWTWIGHFQDYFRDSRGSITLH